MSALVCSRLMHAICCANHLMNASYIVSCKQVYYMYVNIYRMNYYAGLITIIIAALVDGSRVYSGVDVYTVLERN